jgi:hypothetical protein
MTETAAITLDAFIRAMSKVTERLFDKHGRMTPHFIGDTPDGERVVFPVPCDLDKDLAADVMRAVAKEHALVRCVLIDEIWAIDVDVSKLSAAERAALKAKVKRDGAANDPARIEQVVFLAEDYVTGGVMATRDIVRPAHGKPYLGKLTIARYSSADGRFAGLLAPRGRLQ